MYDTQERMRRVQRAARRYLRRQEQRALRRLGGLCGALALGLGAALSRFTGGTAGAVQGLSGATLLSESAGGYVFVGVAAFTAASALTLLCVRAQEKEKRNKEKNEESKEDTP